ncbi:MAG: S9 family peptidase [Synergistaceae bacterium]|jgi:dipeptidyl aminopeptidase/acylaminoacyl peptidase|nr:S9 family peptidase [Synergistaceae bacterium]
MTNRVKPHDILKYRFLSSPRFSPDGNKIAFAVNQADIDGNRYLSNIWVYDLASESLTQLTSSGLDKAFCWKEDGSAIIFVSERPPVKDESDGPDKNKKGKKSRLYSIGVKGGEALSLGETPEQVTSIWDAGESLLLKTVHIPEEEKFEDADYIIFTQIPFCSNGKGFTGQRRTALSTYSIGTGTLKRLSPEGMEVGQVRLSSDRKRAIAVGVVYTDILPSTSGVWEFGLNSGKTTALLPQDEYSYACADSFAGGVLVTGTNMKRHGRNENPRFHILKDGKTSCLTPDMDCSIGNSVMCDCRYALSDTGRSFIVDAAGGSEKAWFISTDGYYSHLHTLDAGGKIERAASGLSSIDDYDVSRGRAAVIGLEGLYLQELYIIEDGKERRLTDFNREATTGNGASKPEYVHLENGTKWGLDCWYMRPTGFEEGKKYPAILHVHGGPKATFGDVFFHEMQCWASEDFVVLYCNPRGSDGKGNEFDDIRGEYGTIDYDDLMLFTDWAVKSLPFVDADRLGVTGGSYGGYMTNWIIGHTDRFRAAATQRSICNWISKAGISDIGYYFVPDQHCADIWDDIGKLWWHSPLKYADKIKTPTLLIHSDEDHRCEISQGLQMFTALKRNGVESKICVFKGENHELSRGGRPKPRLARLQEIIKWFREHLS